MMTLLISTRNEHKLAEIQAILGGGIHYLTLDQVEGAPEVQETARTFAGNATKKAVELAQWISVVQPARQQVSFVLADDSGLEVDFLDGAPGVYSARFAAMDSGRGGNSSASENNAKLLRLLEGVPEPRRTARFRCAVALTPVFDSAEEPASRVCNANEYELATEVFEGTCEGRIGNFPQGSGGFGYDPLFFPAGFEQTFGELPGEVKNGLSHRGMALRKLHQWLKSRRLGATRRAN